MCRQTLKAPDQQNGMGSQPGYQRGTIVRVGQTRGRKRAILPLASRGSHLARRLRAASYDRRRTGPCCPVSPSTFKMEPRGFLRSGGVR